MSAAATQVIEDVNWAIRNSIRPAAAYEIREDGKVYDAVGNFYVSIQFMSDDSPNAHQQAIRRQWRAWLQQ